MVQGALNPEILVRTGQIEAISPVNPRYPWLKGHGSIEACLDKAQPHPLRWYPWLKGHGSIEALYVRDSSFAIRLVSMAEGPWLH